MLVRIKHEVILPEESAITYVLESPARIFIMPLPTEELVEKAKSIEKFTYYPAGRSLDGATYSAIGAREFIRKAFMHFGDGDYVKGMEYIESKTRDRQAHEPEADPKCGNWQLWTILNELGVSREQT